MHYLKKYKSEFIPLLNLISIVSYLSYLWFILFDKVRPYLVSTYIPINLFLLMFAISSATLLLVSQEAKDSILMKASIAAGVLIAVLIFIVDALRFGSFSVYVVALSLIIFIGSISAIKEM